MTELRKVKRAGPTFCPECGAETERWGKGAWSCTNETCPSCTEDYRRKISALTEALQSRMGPLQKAMNESREAFDRKLKAAGLSPTGDNDFWVDLRAFGRFDLGLSDEEIGELTEAGLNAFLDRYLREKNAKDEQAAVPAPAPAKRIPEYTSVLKEAIRQALTAKRTSTNRQILEHIDLHRTPELEDLYPDGIAKAYARDGDARHRITSIISKVRKDMGIPVLQ